MNHPCPPRPEVLAELEAFGVDLTLVREMLRRTPDERLRWHGQMLATIRKLRNGRLRSR